MDEFCFCRQERMEELLCDAALRGNLESLREIIATDNYILDKVLVGCFKGKNPVHLSISTGQAQFVEKLLELKPKLAEVVDTELGAALHIASANGDLKIVEALLKCRSEMCMVRDRDGNNPLHIASANGHLKIVEALVKVNPEMCMARDRDGNNPLHIAAMAGKVDVLKKLVRTCPRAALVVLERGDTILHLCVNYDQLDCLKLLVEMIKAPDFVHSKDANDNTILHIAVFGKHVEIIDFVLHHTDIKVNAINKAGWSAMDIYFFVQNRPHRGEVDMNMEDLLRAAEAKGRRQMTVFTPTPRGKELMQTLLVVASLFATMAFQVGVNPPGSVWQETARGHLAGEAILAYKHPLAYACFAYANSVAFFLSLASILFLLMVAMPVPKSPLGWILPVMSFSAIMSTAFAYTYSIMSVSPRRSSFMAGALIYVILGSAILWASLAFLVAIPFLVIHEISRRKDSLKIRDIIYGYSDRRPVFDLYQCLVFWMKSPHAVVDNVASA